MMMSFLSDYGLFLLKTVTLAVFVLVVFVGILSLRKNAKQGLDIRSLNKEYGETKTQIHKEVYGKKPAKMKKRPKDLPRVYVLEFSGDIKASQAEQLREEVTAVLAVATDKDEVVVKLDSPGGAVNGYGLAASQLQRIRDRKIPLTVCIDKIAASGGYLMACVANNIIAAPFAIIGSIGVVAQMPNFHRWLQKHNIDVELLTAGEYKRTLTMIGENTEKGRQKFQEDLEMIHQAFRNYVLNNRQQLDIDKVSTGEHWLAEDAFELKLVDKLSTSDDYLIAQLDDHDVFQVKVHREPSMAEKVLKPAMKLMHPWA